MTTASAVAPSTSYCSSLEMISKGVISEITPLLIISKLEQYDVLGATALAVVMLGLSFILLLTVNMLQWWAANRHKNSEPLEVAAARAGGSE